jgi:tetratricopeptide (TPR) repeat protein
MNSQDLLYLYFSNSLTPEQEDLFHSLLETDAEFKAQFEFEKNLKTVISSHESDTLKTKLKGFERSLNKSSRSIFNYSNLAIAASIVILVGWFGYNSFFGTNYNNLYNDNFTEYPNTVYTITRGDTDNSLEREAFVAYESQDYKMAIEKFDAITEDAKKEYFNFYKAQAYLGLNDIDNARTFFNQVLQDNNQFVGESTWYLALIAIKEKDKDEALTYLKNLIENFDFNKDKAQAILKELN